MKTKITLFVVVSLQLVNWHIYSQQPFMVKDINPGSPSSLNRFLVTNNNALFFDANDGASGSKLWKNDGTNAGTEMVKDIFPGSGSSLFINSIPTGYTGTLYFSADNGINGYELWKSDGTAIGNVMINNIYIGSNIYKLPDSLVPYSLTNVSNTLFFATYDTINGNKLWKSDGTVAGTAKVKETRLGTFNYRSFPGGLTNANGVLCFITNDGINGKEIWKSDGTEAGTTVVKDLCAGACTLNLNKFIYLNSSTYFVANDGIIGRQIFKTDGTANGTIGINILNLIGDS